MQYKTTLTGLEFYAYHGIYAEEQILGQLFRVDVSINMETDKQITKLEEAVNYETIFNTIKLEMAIKQALIETVAQNILTKLKEIYSDGIIEVTIHKPNPAGAFKSGVASVTIQV